MISQNGNNALPGIRNQIANGQNAGNWSVSMSGTPWYRPIQDIVGMATGGLIGNNPTVAYTGSWEGTWTTSSQDANETTINVLGNNPTSADSMTRTPFPRSWGYSGQYPLAASEHPEW